MENTLNLNQMTTEEKIQTMENIWENLCKKADSLSSPTWHKKVLLKREKKIKNGDEKFMDWKKAKKHIEDQI